MLSHIFCLAIYRAIIPDCCVFSHSYRLMFITGVGTPGMPTYLLALALHFPRTNSSFAAINMTTKKPVCLGALLVGTGLLSSFWNWNKIYRIIYYSW